MENDDSTVEGAAIRSTTFNLLVDGILPPTPKNNEDNSSKENESLATSNDLVQENNKEGSTKQNESSVISGE